MHWLETLRLRRVKILEGGYNVRAPPLVCWACGSLTSSLQSLEQFVRELSETTKRVLERYCDSVL